MEAERGAFVFYGHTQVAKWRFEPMFELRGLLLSGAPCQFVLSLACLLVRSLLQCPGPALEPGSQQVQWPWCLGKQGTWGLPFPFHWSGRPRACLPWLVFGICTVPGFIFVNCWKQAVLSLSWDSHQYKMGLETMKPSVTGPEKPPNHSLGSRVYWAPAVQCGGALQPTGLGSHGDYGTLGRDTGYGQRT